MHDHRHIAACVALEVVVVHLDSSGDVGQSTEQTQSGSLGSPGR